MNSSSARSDPQRPKRPSATARTTTDGKELGTPPVESNLCTSLIAVSTAVQSKVTKTVSEKQLLKPEAKDSPTVDESPVLPSSSRSRLGSVCYFARRPP